MGFYEDFLAGLEKVAREQFRNPAQLAEHLGVEPNLITRWLNKDRVPRAERMGEVLDALGAKLVFPGLLGKTIKDVPSIDGATVRGGDDAKSLAAQGLTALGVYAVAGAGPAWEAEQAEPIFHIAVPKQYLRPHIMPLFIKGASMEPTILDNAVVGVNREQREVVQGKIYAVRLPYEGIVVKRLYLDHENARFILKSDNKKDINEFPDIHLPFESGDAFIYGQVSWVLQSYDR